MFRGKLKKNKFNTTSFPFQSFVQVCDLRSHLKPLNKWFDVNLPNIFIIDNFYFLHHYHFGSRSYLISLDCCDSLNVFSCFSSFPLYSLFSRQLARLLQFLKVKTRQSPHKILQRLFCLRAKLLKTYLKARKNLLMKMKEESEKAGLKLNLKKN